MVIVKFVGRVCSFALICLSLRAQTPAYKVGDIAGQDIVAAVPFNMVDGPATAALKASQAQTIAAIYHQFDGETNVIARNFLSAFARAHQSFINAVAAAYHHPVIDNSTIEASDFGYLVTAFNVEHKEFPVTSELAVRWARGDSGNVLRDKWLGMLLQAMDQPVQPDALPPHFLYRKKIRIMPVSRASEKFTFKEAWRNGHVISADKVPTISQVRVKLRRQFSEDAQPLAGALAGFLEPNCFPDAALTKEARDFSVRQLVVSDHFDAGQIIIHRGETIGLQAEAEIEAMNQAMVPGTLNKQIVAEHQHAQQEHALAQQELQQAQVEQQAALLAKQQQQQAQIAVELAQTQAEQNREQAVNAQIAEQQARTRDQWLLGSLAAVSIGAMLISWRLVRRYHTGPGPVLTSTPAKLQRIERPSAAASELAPYLAQTLKEAVVQGLASQRAELLEAQRQAALELAELVQRLDRLQAPMQERIRAYQERIQELQKELAERTEENRELLKMKIEMMRRQIENERGRVRFN